MKGAGICKTWIPLSPSYKLKNSRASAIFEKFVVIEPESDPVALENWKILSSCHSRAEARTLQRIAAKTEEVKGLRDGVRILFDHPGCLAGVLNIDSLVSYLAQHYHAKHLDQQS